MVKNIILLFVFLIAFFSVSNAKILDVKVEEHTLSNGLKILLYHDSYSPTVACRLFYKTGSVNEYPGVSGVSHMFEHMMFKGTKKICVRDWDKDSVLLDSLEKLFIKYKMLKDSSSDSVLIENAFKKFKEVESEEKKLIVKGELWKIYTQNGGMHFNAFTTDILTAYFTTLPKNKLELFFWLESDRLKNAVLREFYSERMVVAEERRLRYENSPTGRYFETLNAMFYEAHPYRNPTIGWMSDIDNFTKKLLREKFKTYYQPNNLILVLAGDFDTKNVLRLAKEYFGRIPRGAPVPEVTIKEPVQVGEKRFTVIKKASPRIDMFFHTPGLGDRDLYALDIIEGVLSGRNGRLYKRLVKKMDLCTDVGAGNGVQKYTSYFHIQAELKDKTDPHVVENVLLSELEKLKNKPLSDYELERVKNSVVSRTVNRFRSTEGIATQLGFWEVMSTWKYINIFPREVEKVTKESVMSVAKKYFTQSNRTVGVLMSKGEGK